MLLVIVDRRLSLKMIIGQAMKYRGTETVDWSTPTNGTLQMDFAAVYRCAAHMMSQMAAEWTQNRP